MIPWEERTWQSKEGLPGSRKALGCLVWSCADPRGRAPLSPLHWVDFRDAAQLLHQQISNQHSPEPVSAVSGFFCAQPLPAPGPTPLWASVAPLAPRWGGGPRARTGLELLSQPSPAPPASQPRPLSSAGHKPLSPGCPSAVPSTALTRGEPSPPATRGVRAKALVYIYFCWVVCTFPGVLFVLFFFFCPILARFFFYICENKVRIQS